MQNPWLPLMAIAGLLVAFPFSATADSLLGALKNGRPTLQLRMSLEHSDLDGNATDAATGLILRTRVGYRTGTFAHTSAYVQLHNVSAWVDRYAPEEAGYDVIADPQGSAVHQAYVDFEGIPGTRLRLGRQEITLEDHRLVGNIGWRQHGQSFDAVTVVNRSVPQLTLIGGYVWKIKTIQNTLVDLDHFIVLHGVYQGIPNHRLSLYTYLLDTPGGTPNDRDKATYGARLKGGFGRIAYAVDYSVQTDYQDAERDGGTMFNGFVSGKFSGVKVGVGYSVISGEDGDKRAFDTLVSTAHKFNGWSDQFLATNGGRLTYGLKDTYLQVGGKLWGTKLLARYHWFQQESRSEDYGRELDLLAARKLADHLTGLVKFAAYEADSGNTSGTAQNDERVFWVRLDYRFF